MEKNLLLIATLCGFIGVLIDPNGKFINAKMPQPEEPAFEIILRKELHLPDEKE